ncbi:hypothetical protein EDB84DRAFT_1638756 [Lactarius hengduanensis]|nr:hypothetical protein EDB84DRAFT_1638756 [Lactarius hengduanensis]
MFKLREKKPGGQSRRTSISRGGLARQLPLKLTSSEPGCRAPVIATRDAHPAAAAPHTGSKLVRFAAQRLLKNSSFAELGQVRQGGQGLFGGRRDPHPLYVATQRPVCEDRGEMSLGLATVGVASWTLENKLGVAGAKKEHLKSQDRSEEQGCANLRTKEIGRPQKKTSLVTVRRNRKRGGRHDVAPARRSSLMRHVRSISQNQPEAQRIAPCHVLFPVSQSFFATAAARTSSFEGESASIDDRRSSPYEGEGNRICVRRVPPLSTATSWAVILTALTLQALYWRLQGRLLPRPRGPEYLAKYTLALALRCVYYTPSSAVCMSFLSSFDGKAATKGFELCITAPAAAHVRGGDTEGRRSLMPSGMVSLALTTNHVVHPEPPNPGLRAHALVGVGGPGVGVKGYLLRCRRHRQRT